MTGEGKSEEDSSETIIENLRAKVARRNALLDIIRKAYHRDVISIKEAFENMPTLEALPSIDLREGFHIFAPQECELRVRPCHECGGQIDLIHRESTRIVEYKYAIQMLEEKEADLRIELLDVKSQAKQDRERLVDTVQRSQDAHTLLLNQVHQLQSQLSDRNAEVERLSTEKDCIEHELEQQQPILLDHKRLLVAIEEAKKESRQLKEKFYDEEKRCGKFQLDNRSLLNQLHQTKKTNEEIQMDLQKVLHQCETLENHSKSFAKDLAESQRKENELTDRLHRAEGTIDELKSVLAHDRERMSREIQDLEKSNKQLAARVNELDIFSSVKAAEAKSYCKRVEDILEGARERGSISIKPSNTDAAFALTDELIRGYETLRQKTSTLSTILSSCIRGLYEDCLSQEQLLRANGSELHRNQQLRPVMDIPNEVARQVMFHLEKSDHSGVIAWRSILSNEEDRNHILGNLHNRLQIGQFSLNKTFEKERNRHDKILRKCQYEHEKEAAKREGKIKELERQLSQAQTVNKKYDRKMMSLQEKYALVFVPLLTSTQDVLRNMRQEFINGDTALTKLREDFFMLRGVTCRILDALQVSRETIQSLNFTIEQQDGDILARDNAISHFEELLTKITHRYAENERRYNKKMHEKSTQAVQNNFVEASTHVDFLPQRSQEGKEKQTPCDALLPGRIFQIRELGKLQFRRAIDKL